MPQDQDPSDFSSKLRLEYAAPRSVPVPRGGLPPRTPAVAVPATPATGATNAPSAKTAAVAQEGRPAIVTAIALYEFWRVLVLGTVYLMTLKDPGAQIESRTFWEVFFVLSNGALAVNYLLPITILYALAIGTTLWIRNNWGRKALIATSAWAVFRLVRYLAVFSSFASMANGMELEALSFIRQCAYMLVAVNITIGLYLAFAPGVAEAFGQEK
ncbi:MAG TPA: hypothetical protein VHX60_03910 [Acidobacteriaceae bacterium]|jgi:hypothetical protein|nr:hypothetical protein [Acidobacteriaceae bacterium]